uniref:Eukaryotic translation initiation factor 3 subunit E-like n=1 Tax=Geotrypetes seraphini TaxID=260995 RepID=A0A6P8QCE6_GEOSA|nr:eukaryotic translation initiation factor 3 subunit E-like [Geotrypetes seraphini]
MQGPWSSEVRRCHINLLELREIFNALQAFLHLLRDRVVLVQMDNQMAMYYVNKQQKLQLLREELELQREQMAVQRQVLKTNTAIIDEILGYARTSRHSSAIFSHPRHLISRRLQPPPVITNKDVRKRRQVLKDLVKVIQQESYTYKDPITEFVECLYVNFDFDGAQKKLRECESVLVNDFFLVACLEDFIENARLFIFETFCRIHQCISISMLADKLNMTPDDAERWIVNLIRNARLDAKIDSKLGHVVMGNNAVSPYQQVIEKTKSLSFRSQMLAMNIEKKLN